LTVPSFLSKKRGRRENEKKDRHTVQRNGSKNTKSILGGRGERVVKWARRDREKREEKRRS